MSRWSYRHRCAGPYVGLGVSSRTSHTRPLHPSLAVYARTCPLYAQQCRGPNLLDGATPVYAPVHVISGWGGPTDWAGLTNSSYPNDAYFPVMSGEDQFGFLELNVNRTHLTLEAILVDTSGTFEPLTPIDTIIIPAPVF